MATSSATGAGTLGADARDPGTDDRVLEVRARAIDRLRLGDVRAVVAQLETLPLSTILGDLDLSVVLGHAAGLSGDTTLARALIEELEWVECSNGLPAAGRVALAHLHMSLCMWEGRMVDLEGSVDILEAELDTARQVSQQHRVIDESAAQAALATGLLCVGRLDDAVHAADKSLVAAELVPVTRNAVLAAGVKALALSWSEAEAPVRRTRQPDVDPARWVEVKPTERSYEAVRQAQVTLDRFKGVGGSPIATHAARCWAGPIEELGDAIESLETAGRELPLPAYEVVVSLCRARAFIRIGDLGTSEAALTVAHERLAAVPQPGYLEVVVARLRDELDQEGASRSQSLTPVEVRALELLAHGASRSEIAHELHYSVNTIKAHLRRAYRKLGAGNRDEAVRNARLRGVIGSS